MPDSYSDDTLAKDLPFLAELCRSLPKLELHQHLTGSFPNKDLRALLVASSPELVSDIVAIKEASDDAPADLGNAWKMLTKYCEAVATAQKGDDNLEKLVVAAIAALAADNIMYCELRIGLKDQPTKTKYLDRMIDVIRQQKEKYPNTTVRLLLSVARHSGVKGGEENIDIAIDYFKAGGANPVVCGVELGGPAILGAWSDFRPMFEKAKAAGLHVALHCGEDPGKQEEWKAMLDFAPGRLGHCVHLDKANLDEVIARTMVVESCLTCHKRHFGIPYKENIFGKLVATNNVVLGTDNPSIYECTLSDEYELCCRQHDLRVGQLFTLARRAIDFTFQEEDAKAHMRKDFDERVREIRRKFGLRSESCSSPTKRPRDAQ